MKEFKPKLFRFFARSSALLLANAVIPPNVHLAIAASVSGIHKASASVPVKAPRTSHPLNRKQMCSLQGRIGQCPYLAGQNKWDVIYNGVDMMTGSYQVSNTDLDFEGGYGIPVNVTRSYNSNQYDDGPFGEGWTLSADTRTMAGGLLKTPGGTSNSVPASLQQRPAQETDPNAVMANGQAAQPVQAVTTTDAGGHQETVQKDVDGVLTTPPWDNNVHNATYKWVSPSWANGATYQIVMSDTVSTMDGTTYSYQSKGSYPNGQLPYNASYMTTPPSPTPTNILKPVMVTDRQGNTTNYAYGAGTIIFNKSDGQTAENPLVSVQMPNQHTLTFNWTGNRVTSISDGTGRTVSYGYNSSGLLTSVTSPGGRTTTYTYGAPLTSFQEYGADWPYDVATNLLTQITDPRGINTKIYYCMECIYYGPYQAYLPSPNVISVVTDGKPQTTYQYQNDSGGAQAPNCRAWDIVVPDGSLALTTTSGVIYIDNYNVGMNTNPSAGEFEVFSWSGTDVEDGPYVPADSGTWGTYWNYSLPIADWIKFYTLSTNDLVIDEEYIRPVTSGVQYLSSGSESSLYEFQVNPYLPGTGWQGQSVSTRSQYNFAGQQLSKVITEQQLQDGVISTYASNETDYAYWDFDKYYQLKATKSKNGDGSDRYIYKDYYPDTAAAGARGQLYKLYDPGHGVYGVDNSASIPTWAVATDYWKYNIVPNSNSYSSLYLYDSVGRITDVYKLQSTLGSSWGYVHTTTSYSGASGSWGEPTQIIEDVGGINRTTTTVGWTSDGTADDVIDAAGHEFVTDFDPDELVKCVREVDNGQNALIKKYTYGSGVAEGMLVEAKDGLSGVDQTFTYVQPGSNGVGQMNGFSESNGSTTYSCNSQFDQAGRKVETTYVTPQSTTSWSYGGYVQCGDVTSPGEAFTKLTKLDSLGNPSPEEFDYLYDSEGRLESATFAQTPAANFTPSTGQPWYDSGHPASTRARAYYMYDPAGRQLGIAHYWDTYVGGYPSNPPYTSQAILANTCSYEVSGPGRGVKISSTFWNQSTSNASQFSQAWQETYGYDNFLDSLVSANYGDGQANSSQSWSYDAAGNRSSDYTGRSWSYDNLNRLTSSPGFSYTNDILGNRTQKVPVGGAGGQQSWDPVNRLVQAYPSSGAMGVAPSGFTSFAYRADGLRVEKIDHTGIAQIGGGEVGDSYTWYRYDGRMPAETYEVNGDNSTSLVDNGLGARGVDYVQTISTPASGGSPTTMVSFPVYDAHGNQVASLSRNGNSYSLGGQRSFGAWGEVRQGTASGGTSSRFCADLGHVQDDETGLIYMRARYYDPTSGRFVSEDKAHDGANWFTYCSDNPVNAVDESGNWLDLKKAWIDVINSYNAMKQFENAEAKATSSLDIENAWGNFMSTWGGGYLATDEAYWDESDRRFTASDWQNIAKAWMQQQDEIEAIGAASRAAVEAYNIHIIEDGIPIGAKLAILGYAYNLRIAWYIDDIGKDD